MKRPTLFFGIVFFLWNASVAQEFDRKPIAEKYVHDQLYKYLGYTWQEVQMAQGTPAISNDSFWLWNFFNTLPAKSHSMYHNPVQLIQFSSVFGLVLYMSEPQVTIDSTCNLNQSILKFIDANNLYAWNKTIDELRSDLSKSEPISIKKDTTIIHKSFDGLTKDTIALAMRINFEHMLVFKSLPYETSERFIYDEKPWYTHCILKESYKNRNSTHWDFLFGSEGILQRIMVGVIVVEDGELSLTSLDGSKIYKKISAGNLPIVLGVVVFPIEKFVQMEKD